MTTLLGPTIRRAWTGAWNAFVRRAPTSRAAYGTHVPVLMACSAIIRPQRVLELGCGLYSTPLFLDSKCWPDLKHITSIETDDKWLQRVVAQLGDDPRWTPQTIGTTVAEWLSNGGCAVGFGHADHTLSSMHSHRKQECAIAPTSCSYKGCRALTLHCEGMGKRVCHPWI